MALCEPNWLQGPSVDFHPFPLTYDSIKVVSFAVSGQHVKGKGSSFRNKTFEVNLGSFGRRSL